MVVFEQRGPELLSLQVPCLFLLQQSTATGTTHHATVLAHVSTVAE